MNCCSSFLAPFPPTLHGIHVCVSHSCMLFLSIKCCHEGNAAKCDRKRNNSWMWPEMKREQSVVVATWLPGQESMRESETALMKSWDQVLSSDKAKMALPQWPCFGHSLAFETRCQSERRDFSHSPNVDGLCGQHQTILTGPWRPAQNGSTGSFSRS